jgi:hypothetical protein
MALFVKTFGLLFQRKANIKGEEMWVGPLFGNCLGYFFTKPSCRSAPNVARNRRRKNFDDCISKIAPEEKELVFMA